LASSKIAFASYASHWQIFTVNPHGTGMHRLTDLPTDQFHPAWSPDGTRIAFDAQSQGGPFELDVMNADGPGLERLTDGPGWNYLPDWSPDGARIAFVSTRDTPGRSLEIRGHHSHRASEGRSPKLSPGDRL
jgi:Tol biopolymer transport system component